MNTSADEEEAENEDWWSEAEEIYAIRATSSEEEKKFLSWGLLPPPKPPPPPPRPKFLEEEGITDSVDTCDLCDWARHHADETDSGGRTQNWVICLIVVSLLSALIGAIAMVAIIKCKKKLKNLRHDTGNGPAVGLDERDETSVRSTAKKSRSNKVSESTLRGSRQRMYSEVERRGRLWFWTTHRTIKVPSQLGSPAPPALNNHYTLEDCHRTAQDEALYAEIDGTSLDCVSYQNAGYINFHTQPVESVRSGSVEFGSLSSSSSHHRTYESIEDQNTLPYEGSTSHAQVTMETITVPSDYV